LRASVKMALALLATKTSFAAATLPPGSSPCTATDTKDSNIIVKKVFIACSTYCAISTANPKTKRP
jgi:hypothetical protein